MHLPPPQTTGLFHIVGIGGIGMSAIAEVMHTRGYRVQGSDLKEGANLQRLRDHGIACLIGHDPGNIEGASYLVISSAVKSGNPEFEAAKERGVRVSCDLNYRRKLWSPDEARAAMTRLMPPLDGR